MIARFSRLVLNTLSNMGTKQFYHGLLGFPVVFEGDGVIRFQPASGVELTFRETVEPLSPAHLAFEVPFADFEMIVARLVDRGIPLTQWPDGRTIDDYGTGKNVYFRDDSGNLLEIIAHRTVAAEEYVRSGPLNILFLREVGFPVSDVIAFRETLADALNLRLDKVLDDFCFAIGGTAHFVIASVHRRWIPISMIALPPKMEVTLQVSDPGVMEEVWERLGDRGILATFDDRGSLSFNLEGYPFTLER